MGLFDWLAKMQPKPPKGKGAVYGWTGLLTQPGTANILPDNPTMANAVDAYSRNATVRAAVDTIANAAASVPLVAYRGEGTKKAAAIAKQRGLKDALAYLRRERKEQIDYGNVEELDGNYEVIANLLNPNPQQSRDEWIAAFVGYQLLAGNTYIMSTNAVQPGRPRRSELYFLNPDAVRVEDDGIIGDPKRYVYRPANGQEQVFGPDRVLHIKASAWTDLGISPLASCADAVNQNTQARKWNTQLLQNNGKPAAHANYNGEEGLDDESYDRLLQDLNAFFKPQNSGKVILTTNTDLKEWGMSPAEMSWLEGLNESSREICRAFRVAPQILGDVTTQTYANYREARQSLYMDTVIPVLERLTSALTRWYRAYDETFLLMPNVDEIEALSENVSDRFTRANAATMLKVDERRMMVGYEPIGGELGSAILVSSAMAPLDMVANPIDMLNDDEPIPGTSAEPKPADEGDGADAAE